ncbi:carboxypeptidase regulatory-like domain-containing protein [Edaphobacter sp. 12200R-103]|uniref:carboxypeptidase regulatory-like domain-containing protein n=1 Tax=Edaphobacter sp. 12200R-103 TaxID=2703788 RepID=UPI00138B98B3|nr:carboxypeptidase regulatory-like domain-containing protein [Edaphobacter sp. 12200R-103]QHS53213.1 TonB-dependent receptor [Edaphobacter sp. 12200R-103]
MSTRAKAWVSVLAALLLMLTGAPAMAQFESASVLGYVHDSSGAAIPSSNVTLTNTATGISQSKPTDAEGKYEFPSVQIGNYTVTAEAQGFSRAVTEPFVVQTNARQRVDVTLQAGSVSEEVTVTSAAQLLDTETSSHSTVIGTKQVEDLPLNGRSYADLVLLVPGARKSLLENNGTSSREGSFNINGQRSAFNNYLLDGLDNNNYGTSNQGFANENIPPSPDAMSEFRVETNNYSAEYGRSTGAVINASIRRGTNQFHGRAWDYNRNTVFNAIGPFLAPGASKPKFIQNQFGGTFGGPIWKDHTFFFVDYEGLRRIFNNASSTSTLPTTNQRNGLFYLNDDPSNPANAIPLRNPITGQKYLGQIPTADMTSFAKAVFGALPSPNTNGLLSNNFAITPRGTINDDKGDGRVDHTFNDHWTIFGRYSEHRQSLFDPPGIPGRAGGNSNGNVNIQNRNIAGGATWTISANKLLDIRFGWSRNLGGKFPIGQGQSSMLVENGITDGLPTDPLVVRSLNAQSVTGFSQFGAQSSNPQFQNPTIYNPKANFTWIKGKHSMKFGYEWQAVNTEVNDFNPSYGQDNYSGQFAKDTSTNNGTSANTVGCASNATSANCSAIAAGAPNLGAQLQQAQNLADFMFGNRSQYSLTTYAIVHLRQRYNFMYFQDDIKVSPKLTINAGLRYEIVTPQYEKDNRLSNFDPGTNSLIHARSGGVYSRSLVNTPKNNWAPRFGLAYSANDKTVLRAGYGIVYSQWNRAGGENNLTYNGPDVVNASITQGTSSGTFPSPSTLCTDDTQLQSSCFRQTQQGYAQNLTSPAYFNPLNALSRYIPRDFKTGYVQQYQIGIQRQLGHGFVADIAYVGNKSTHLQTLADYNQATPCTTGSCGSLQSRRPIKNFAGIEIAYGIGSANYNSLQFKLEKRASKGLYLLNSFTYGRVFDISSGHLETSGGDNSRVNYANPSNDYGPGGYDQPLADTLSVVYDLPYGHGRHWGGGSGRMMNTVLGGWQVTLINTMTSGLPVNITYSIPSSSGLYVSDIVTYRPNRVNNGPIKGPSSGRKKTATSLQNYFVSTNLTAPTTNPWGNVSRNSERSNAFYQADFGLHKAFPLWSESSNLDFRAEAFNVLNKVNYSSPNSTFGGSSFGQITSAFPARQLQLAAKIIF